MEPRFSTVEGNGVGVATVCGGVGLVSSDEGFERIVGGFRLNSLDESGSELILVGLDSFELDVVGVNDLILTEDRLDGFGLEVVDETFNVLIGVTFVSSVVIGVGLDAFGLKVIGVDDIRTTGVGLDGF